MSNANGELSSRLGGIQWPALFVGLACLIACAVGWARSPHDFFPAYLFAYLYWLGITLGSLAMVMMFHCTGGLWGRLIGRLGEAASLTLPLMIVLFVPIVFGLHDLYGWSQPGTMADPNFAHRRIYLNVPFWLVRTAIYFAAWTIIAFVLNGWSLRESQVDPHSNRLQGLGGAGIVIYAVTMTFASIDWIMSRDTEFFSTIYGFVITVGQTLSGLTFLILCVPLVASQPPLKKLGKPQVFIDLGNLVLVLVILWTYMTFVQFLVIWMGDLQADISWYTQREFGNQPHVWLWIAAFLILFQFFVPFFLLLFRDLKRNPKFLCGLAAWMLLTHLVEEFWLVIPDGPHKGPHWHFCWMDIVAPIGIGGVWISYFIWQLKDRALVPIADPHQIEVAHA